MTETTLQITSGETKPKDPRRADAGKRLGAISKAAKGKKARERYDREREDAAEGDGTSGWKIPLVGAAVRGVAFLCYKNRHRIGKTQPDDDSDDRIDYVAPDPVPEPVTKSGRKLGSFH